MNNFDEQDDIPAMNRKDTAHDLPMPWVLFFLALIVWGIFYLYQYTPEFTGWTQNAAFEETWSANKPK